MILVTGGSGLLGNAFKGIASDILYPTRKELDLYNKTNPSFNCEDINEWLSYPNLEAVIHLASKVGGVKANTDFVSDFYQINSQINNNLINYCIK
jgi:GDP-L-fucose synthase